MTRQDGPRYNDEHLRQGSPANSTLVETIPRWAAAADNAIAATGVELSIGVPVQVGEVISSITFVTGGTAAVTPTAGYAVLRDPSGTKLVQTADFGSTARAANTAYTVTLTTPYTVTTAGVYYVGISFTAGTIPTLRGCTVGNAVVAGALGLSQKILSQTHGSSVGATAPATIATPTTTAVIPYVVLS